MPVDACLVILLLLCDKIAPIFSVGVMVFVNNLLNKNAFLVKEHVGLFKAANTFDIFDPQNNLICQLQGKWTGWDFHFIHNGRNLAHVSKQWMGMGKELFTSADNYILSIEPSVEQDDKIRLVILAAVMCIDMVLKE